jgi:hypothetical protein
MEQVEEKGSTVGTRCQTCPPSIHNTYVVDQKLKRFDDVSFREHFGRIICFQTKICPFLRQGWPFFFMEQS